MTLTEETIETAARAAYAKTRELAPKYYAPADMKRYLPWEDVSEEWRSDYKSAIKAALKTIDLG